MTSNVRTCRNCSIMWARRSEGASAVLAMMQAAVDELAQGSGSSSPGAAHAASNGMTKSHNDASLGALSCQCTFATAPVLPRDDGVHERLLLSLVGSSSHCTSK